LPHLFGNNIPRNFLPRFGGCITVSPYLGTDGVSPFIDAEDKAAFVLCKTSNPGSNDLQTLVVTGNPVDDGNASANPNTDPDNEAWAKAEPVYVKVARKCQEWNKTYFDNVGLVVGATDAVAMKTIRESIGNDIWILAPGIGAQGGNLTDAVRNGSGWFLERMDTSEKKGVMPRILLPISRGISRAADMKQAADDFAKQMNEALL
jgi:orotidine-5'-phosphate decarboxylase